MPRAAAAVAVVTTALVLSALPGLAPAASAAEPAYGEVLNILPPGQSGTITAADARQGGGG